ncbi:hypothetical protein QBC38DRAFT_483893 [Podospora fimiseda]|uniref:Uncharacterized protein n=1 Tax=Podospora fimiseda TaxID=252190 RepID=A0AAN7BKS5_9PEZI|nr:hypothetical protein QBC38DRAFT_483893 [Podospora fimiseda]
MFGSRRHHRPNPPLTASTADPNAATAAAAVFKRHESNANATLSAAAAAAALRARPMTPTRVGDVQTKRTLRRSASIASSGTASPIIQGRPSLQRRGSSGSMTERTFRSPSPHRPGSGASGHRHTKSLVSDAPPVPALPKDVGSQHRKSNSLGMGTTPLRLASERLKSDDAPSWFSAAKLGDPANMRKTDPAMASPPSSPPQMPIRQEDAADAGRPSSRASSVNFSYPARTRVGSPPVSPVDVRDSVDSPANVSLGLPSMGDRSPQASRTKQQQQQQPTRQSSVSSPRKSLASTSSDLTLVYDPNSRRMVPQADNRNVHQGTVEPLLHSFGSKKKKKNTQRAGAHLVAGDRVKSIAVNDVSTENAPNRSTALVAEGTTPISASPAQQTREEPEEPAVKAIINSPRLEARKREQKQLAQDTVKTSYTNDTIPLPTSPAWQGVRRQPSVVKEESEPEDQVTVVRNTAKQRAHAKTDSEVHINPEPSRREHSPLPDSGRVYPQNDQKRQVQVAHQRSHSNSPARQAHFGPVQETLTVKHSPPPRSISPRKSALKHSSPNRGASFSDDTSEASMTVSHEPAVGRKKSVRVSFDDSKIDDTGDSGRANSPISPTSPPQDSIRRRWLGNLGRDKNDLSLLDDEEIMKPRPALPSFGSVRAKKPRSVSPEETERPLVRPLGETVQSASAPVGPSLLPSPSLASSNDHAIGGIFFKDIEEKGKGSAGTSGFVEPLPPVVTSVEGTGYFSDSESFIESSHDSEGPDMFHEMSDTDEKQANGSTHTITTPVVHGVSVTGTVTGAKIPVISISEPTPPVIENKTLKQYFVDIPGGFPEDESDPPSMSSPKDATTAAPAIHPLQPSSKDDQKSATATNPTPMDQSSDSESSIYSDAYEDLSGITGGGFQSLNAVVETPLQTIPETGVLSNQSTNQASSPPFIKATTKPQIEAPAAHAVTQGPEDEWERVKAYWKTLSAEKRAQLEREATEDAGIEGDLEDQKHEPKPKKKKSLERRNSERKALALRMAQQTVAQSQPETLPVAERNYQIKPGTNWADEDVAVSHTVPTMRKSMRGVPPQSSASESTSGAPRLRKSMRGAASSPRSPEPVSSSSATAPGYQQASAQTTLSAPALKRRDSSDSESSFKRSRPRGGEQVFGFRKSMRPTSPPLVKGDARSPMRLSLRGASPAGLQMRDSSTGRKSPTGIHMPSFGKKSSAKSLVPKSSLNKFSSRFGDSSDEGSYASASGFQSRFEDSSDDEPAVYAPISIPQSRSAPATTSLGRNLRTQESLASTALPEELEESDEPPHTDMNGNAQKPAAAQEQNASATNAPSQPVLSVGTSPNQIRRSGKGIIVPASQTAPALGTSAAVSSPVTETKASRRNSILSVLRRKKHDSGGISRAGPTESAARRDTKLERSEAELKNIKLDKDAGTETSSPVETTQPPPPPPPAPAPLVEQPAAPVSRSPKLRKKTPVMILPGGEELTGDLELKRAPTSVSGNLGTRTLSGTFLHNNNNHQRKITMFSSSSTDGGGGGGPSSVHTADGASVAGSNSGMGTPKKKRFKGLRRMFKLDE